MNNISPEKNLKIIDKENQIIRELFNSIELKIKSIISDFESIKELVEEKCQR